MGRKSGGRKSGAATRRRSSPRSRPASGVSLSHEDAPEELVRALKAWRLTKAKQRRIPAFRILTDRTLLEVAISAPRDDEALLAVKGMGPRLVGKYGREILALVRNPNV